MRHKPEYYEGYEAYVFKQASANPYEKGSREHHCYEDGWDQGEVDAVQLEWINNFVANKKEAR